MSSTCKAGADKTGSLSAGLLWPQKPSIDDYMAQSTSDEHMPETASPGEAPSLELTGGRGFPLHPSHESLYQDKSPDRMVFLG